MSGSLTVHLGAAPLAASDHLDVMNAAAFAELPWGARLRVAELMKARGRGEEIEALLGDADGWESYPERLLRAARVLESENPRLALEALARVISSHKTSQRERYAADALLLRICRTAGSEALLEKRLSRGKRRLHLPAITNLHRKKGRFTAIVVMIAVHIAIVVGLILFALPGHWEEPLIVTAISPGEQEKPRQLSPTFNASKLRPSAAAGGGASMKLIAVQAPAPLSIPRLDDGEIANLGSGEVDGLGFGDSIGEGGSFKAPPGGSSTKLTGIEATHLGVVIDVSGSMGHHLPGLIREIKRRFPDAVVVVCPNSRLELAADSSSVSVSGGYISKYLKKFKKNGVAKPDIGTGILYLLRHTDCDAIYVMSDFHDGESRPDPCTAIATVAKAKKVALHLALPTKVSGLPNFAQRKSWLAILFGYAKENGSVRTKLN